MTLVVVQRGHVPRKTGATGAPGEQQFAIDTAAILRPLLQDMKFGVRVIDADESLSEYKGNIFVAIHYDSGSPSASGASVGYQSAEGGRLAKIWKESYVQAGWRRGFRNDNYTANLAQYYGVSNAIRAGNKAAIITESGFHSNTGDDVMMTPYRTAISIADAIAKFTGRESDDMSAADVEAIENHIDKRISDANLAYSFQGHTGEASLRQIVTRMYTQVGQLEQKLDAVIAQLNAGE